MICIISTFITWLRDATTLKVSSSTTVAIRWSRKTRLSTENSPTSKSFVPKSLSLSKRLMLFHRVLWLCQTGSFIQSVFMNKYVQWTKIEISNTITLNIIFVALFLKCVCKRLGLIHCLNLGSLIRSVPAKLIYHSFKMGSMDPLVTNFCFVSAPQDRISNTIMFDSPLKCTQKPQPVVKKLVQ